MNQLEELIAGHEGLRLDLYQDTVGKWTIGYGHNIEDNGITKWTAEQMLTADVNHAHLECYQTFIWFKLLDEVRQAVIVDMVFNMGMPRFKGFKKTIKYISKNLFETASVEMLDSKWAKQVKGRSEKLSQMMRKGEWL